MDDVDDIKGKSISIREGETFLVTATKTLREILALDIPIAYMSFPKYIKFEGVEYTLHVDVEFGIYNLHRSRKKIEKQREWVKKLSNIFLSQILTYREAENCPVMMTYLIRNRVSLYYQNDKFKRLVCISYEKRDRCIFTKDIIDAPPIFDTLESCLPLPAALNKMISEDFVGSDELMKFDMLVDRILS